MKFAFFASRASRSEALGFTDIASASISLTAEGGKPGRDLEWHVRHFRNPAAVVPGSIMPPLADLSEDDVKALAAYMLSLK